MTKINHNRPSLRLLDNYRRELNLQVGAGGTLPSGKAKKSARNSMPQVSEEARTIIISIFDAADCYLEDFSNYMKSLSPEAAKTLRKKQAALEEKLGLSKEKLVGSCVQLVIEAIGEASRDRKDVVEWLKWLEKEAQRTNSYALYDILEVGVKPAFERLDAAADRL